MIFPPNKHSPVPPPHQPVTQTQPGETQPPTDQLRPPNRQHITQSIEVSQEDGRGTPIPIRPTAPEQQPPPINRSSPEPGRTTLVTPFEHERSEEQEQQRQQVLHQREQEEIQQNAVAAASARNSGPFNHRSQWNRTVTVNEDSSSTVNHISLLALLITLLLTLM